MTEKQYVDAQQLLEDSFELGFRIIESGFVPDFIVGVWRGGTPVGIAVQELLDFFGIETDHIAIRTSSYAGIGERRSAVKVHGLNYVIDNINAENALLIVDDVFDSGKSIRAIIEHLRRRARKNTPGDIRIATAYFKPKNNRTNYVPDYFVHETDRWLVFPHEMHGLTHEEIVANKRGLKGLLARAERIRAARRPGATKPAR